MWKIVKKTFSVIIFIALIAGSVFSVYRYYDLLFAKVVEGEIVKLQSSEMDSAASYILALKLDNGTIMTTKSRDSQWRLGEVGQCAKVKFFPHPPWDLKNKGTYKDALLVHLSQCLQESTYVDEAIPSVRKKFDIDIEERRRRRREADRLAQSQVQDVEVVRRELEPEDKKKAKQLVEPKVETQDYANPYNPFGDGEKKEK